MKSVYYLILVHDIELRKKTVVTFKIAREWNMLYEKL